jgi:hypothetical protein
MIDIDLIASQIKHNCNISDAKFWGFYSPCGLLLRLRDLYRVENNLRPWEKISHGKIGKWIDERENLWQELEENEFQSIDIQGREYKPFDVKKINSVLLNHGYIYAAGYGNMLKPVFLLAGLSEKYTIKRCTVQVSGKEIARDLSTSPAMIQGNTIIARNQTTNLFFWEKYEEMKAQRRNGALFHAFSEYNISKDAESTTPHEKLQKKMEEIVREELSTYVHHELGEASQRRVLGRWWKELLLRVPYSRAELFLRGLKDVLSDTCRTGMLAHIIENKKAGSLGFYIALSGGFRRSILSDMTTAYKEFLKTRSWKLIEETRVEGYKKTGDYIRHLKYMFDTGKVSQEAIEEIMPKA